MWDELHISVFCDFDQLIKLVDLLLMILKTAPLDTVWYSCFSKVRRNLKRTFRGKKINKSCTIWFFWASEWDSSPYVQEEGGFRLASQFLSFVKPILLQNCLSLGHQKTTNEKTDFAIGMDLSTRRLGKAELKNECLVYARPLPERGKTQFVHIKWQLLK